MITQTLQSPPIFSSAFNPIVWMVASDAVNNYNFKYVFDVYISGTALPLRFKTPPNPRGAGLIDVQSIVQSTISTIVSVPALSPTPFYGGTGMAGTVYVLVGEEYATTLGGTVTLYNGLGAPGEPAYGLYADGNFRPCPNNTTPVVALAWGQGAFDYYDYIALGGESVLDYMIARSWNTPDSGGQFLTRWESALSQTIRSDEDFTLSWLNYDPEANNYRQVPYAMVVTGYLNGATAGTETFYNTVANGGTWTSCTTPPAGATASPANWINNFKLNVADINLTGTTFRDKTDIFGIYWEWGIYQPIPDCFPDSDSPVGTTLAWSVYDDTYMTIGTTGTTGYSNIAYKTMEVLDGSTIYIGIPSLNFYVGTYADLQLWGEHNGVFEYVTTFNKQAVFGGSSTYIVPNYVTTKDYTALGLRAYQAGSVDEPFSLGAPIALWNITGPNPAAPFDSFCCALYPYDNYSACTLGATADSVSMCFTVDDTNCWGFDPIRFTWLNNLGGKDWYTMIKRNTNVQNAQRTTMYKLPGYWSNATYSVQDNSPARYGTITTRVDLTNTWTASTNWLSDQESAFLRNMFASPQVLAYLPGRSQPTLITITDASYTVNTTVREKLFQYFVSFTEANPDVVQQSI
jgi:hypothetical protein